jgi:hypothetical protein
MASPEEKMTRLQAVLKAIDDGITKKDFVESFKNVISYVKRIDEKLTADFQALSARIDARVSAIKDGVDGKDGKDGKDGVDGVDGADGEDGQDATLDMNALVKQVLEKIRPTDLKPVWDEIEKMKTDPHPYDQTVKPGITVFGPGKSRVHLTDISPLLDGTTKTFTLPLNFGIIGVASSSAPFAFRQGIDYSSVGKTIVFLDGVDAPSMLSAGQTIIITTIR